jgi:hypothetical protein
MEQVLRFSIERKYLQLRTPLLIIEISEIDWRGLLLFLMRKTSLINKNQLIQKIHFIVTETVVREEEDIKYLIYNQLPK